MPHAEFLQEHDTVSVEEIRFGDNDTLSAMVCNLVDADTLIEPDALLRLARPFLLGKPVAAVGGTIRVANSCTIAASANAVFAAKTLRCSLC